MKTTKTKQPQNLLQLIGNTPLIELKRFSPNPQVKIYAKMECFNPGGSIKDRVALAMIEEAEQRGELSQDKIVIEATSGNTGIGLALVCAQKGYKLTLLMPESASQERKKILKAYGAKLILTPAHLGTDGAIEEAYRLAREEPEKYVLMDQFNNPASIKAHYETTGREIWEQTEGKITHFVAALGTSGTAMGTTKRLKKFNSKIFCVGIEPRPGHKIQGLKNMQESYPPGIYDPTLLDEILRVEDEEAFELCRRLAREEGLLVGMSSGAALAGALKIAKRIEQGVLVVVFPDGGERYLSTPLFLEEPAFSFSLKGLTSPVKIEKKNLDLFTFGPSLDQLEELGFWRRMVGLDILARYLRSLNIEANILVGIADFEDRTLNLCRSLGLKREKLKERAKEKLEKIASRFKLQGVQFLFASEVLEEGVKLCSLLLSKGKAYEKLRSVYFDVQREPEYGKLVLKNTKLRLEQRGLGVYYLKDNPKDFTLLKRASLQDLKEGEVLKTSWGNVRPSWYLQQASIVLARSKNPFLVFCGCEHILPHIDNLHSLWQNTAKGVPLGWVHICGVKSELLRLREEDFFVLRSLFSATSWSKVLEIKEENLKMWQKNWRKFSDTYLKLKKITTQGEESSLKIEGYCSRLKEQVNLYLSNGFQLFRLWPEIFSFLKLVNKRIQTRNLSSKDKENLLNVFSFLRDILGLKSEESTLPQAVQELLEQRKRAKEAKNYSLADELREKLKQLGYLVIDLEKNQQMVKKL